MPRRRPPRGRARSKGYQVAKLSAAKAHKKLARQRQHTARTWVRRVVADHQDIAAQDFIPRFMSRSTMAPQSADGGIGATKHELVEYAQRVWRKVVHVPPAYTTVTCSRRFAAAKVNLAMAGFNHADVEAVRHLGLPSGEVLVLAESEIPRLWPWGGFKR